MLSTLSIITLFVVGNIAARYIGDLWFVPRFNPALLIVLGCYLWIFPLVFYWKNWVNSLPSPEEVHHVLLLAMFLLACVNFGEVFTNGHDAKNCIVRHRINDKITIEQCLVGPSAAAVFQVNEGDIHMRFIAYTHHYIDD